MESSGVKERLVSFLKYKKMSQAEGKYRDKGEEGTCRKILSQGSA